jgi:carbohydrate diacid regulator
MALQQVLAKCLEEWKEISHLDFTLLDSDNRIYTTTCERKLPAESKLAEFRQSPALCIGSTSRAIYKVTENTEVLYLLIVWGSKDDLATIGELAVCQIRTLLTAYAEKSDKNVFMQNLLLGKYSEVEAFNQARKMRISTTAKRAVFLVETRQNKDSHALATIRNIFSARTRDFITAIDETGIIVIRELSSTEDYDELENIAYMLVDMLNTEAMTSAWVSYSNIAEDFRQLENAYKEARTALEVGKIFYAQSNVFGYNKLGIGRLIYQLPISICEMFIAEIFKNENTLDSIDEESLITIRTFFENNLNLSETSRQLYVHRNTLVYRFEKLQKKFGLDIRTFEDALTFKIAMMVSDYITYHRKHLSTAAPMESPDK